jgi:hypothetical protein
MYIYTSVYKDRRVSGGTCTYMNIYVTYMDTYVHTHICIEYVYIDRICVPLVIESPLPPRNEGTYDLTVSVLTILNISVLTGSACSTVW